jgi:dTDP-4-dehydrorhamnose reductase
VTPTYIPDLVDSTLDLLLDGERGIVHLANAGAVSWYELASRAARAADISTATLRAVHDWPSSRAKRPSYSALASGRVAPLPPLDDALDRYVEARDHASNQV